MTKHDLSLRESFMCYIQIPENLDGCWEWTGGKNSDGYGHFHIKRKSYRAHRISFELFVGPIPEGMYVCHSCDNRACVNPSHLFLGTQKDNVQDMYNKSRQSNKRAKGENNGQHKLTEQNIYQIREMIEQGYSQREIAKRFDVSHQQISDIKSGKIWSWLK